MVCSGHQLLSRSGFPGTSPPPHTGAVQCVQVGPLLAEGEGRLRLVCLQQRRENGEQEVWMQAGVGGCSKGGVEVGR